MNSGVMVLKSFDPGRPVMITGMGRCGTTGLARAMKAMGLTSYYLDESVNAEEQVIMKGMHGGPVKCANALRDLRASRPPVWVGKLPMLGVVASRIKEVEEAWDGNWITMVRDPVALACRDESGANGMEGAESIHFFTAHTSVTVAAAGSLSKSNGGVIVSYEKLLSSPGLVLGQIAAWMGDDSLDIKAGADEVMTGDPRYIGL